jgi:hypothetical protein
VQGIFLERPSEPLSSAGQPIDAYPSRGSRHDRALTGNGAGRLKTAKDLADPRLTDPERVRDARLGAGGRWEIMEPLPR